MSSITAPNEEVKLRPLFVKPLSKKESLSLKPVSESKAFREVPVNKRESQPDRRADDLDFVSPVQGEYTWFASYQIHKLILDYKSLSNMIQHDDLIRTISRTPLFSFVFSFVYFLNKEFLQLET